MKFVTGVQQPDRQYCILLHRLLEAESIATYQTTQYQLYSELVEGSSWAGGPGENLITFISLILYLLLYFTFN